MFFAYLLSPRTFHRFVGYLEEEAVITYTRQIKDIDNGLLPEWKTMEAPQIAIDYWKMPEGHQTMRDLLLYSTGPSALPFSAADIVYSTRRREQAQRGQPHLWKPRPEGGT